jgi:hypothetical protein
MIDWRSGGSDYLMLPFDLFQFWDNATRYGDSGENQGTDVARMAEWGTAPERRRKTLMNQ